MDRTQINFKERIANNVGLSYVYAGGNIGIVSNGAGLAMATMDAVSYFGGNPSNFMDIGGGASYENIVDAVKLL